MSGPTAEELLNQARTRLAYLNNLSRQLGRSGNPARRATGQEIKQILEMEIEA